MEFVTSSRIDTRWASPRRWRSCRNFLEQLLSHDSMHRGRRVTLMVEEVRRRIGDRGWILIEDRASGARARGVEDAVCRRMLHHLVERSAPVVQPQIEACRGGLLADELLVGGIQSKPHGRELR